MQIIVRCLAPSDGKLDIIQAQLNSPRWTRPSEVSLICGLEELVIFLALSLLERALSFSAGGWGLILFPSNATPGSLRLERPGLCWRQEMEIIKVVSEAFSIEAKMNSAIGHASESQERI